MAMITATTRVDCVTDGYTNPWLSAEADVDAAIMYFIMNDIVQPDFNAAAERAVGAIAKDTQFKHVIVVGLRPNIPIKMVTALLMPGAITRRDETNSSVPIIAIVGLTTETAEMAAGAAMTALAMRWADQTRCATKPTLYTRKSEVARYTTWNVPLMVAKHWTIGDNERIMVPACVGCALVTDFIPTININVTIDIAIIPRDCHSLILGRYPTKDDGVWIFKHAAEVLSTVAVELVHEGLSRSTYEAVMRTLCISTPLHILMTHQHPTTDIPFDTYHSHLDTPQSESPWVLPVVMAAFLSLTSVTLLIHTLVRCCFSTRLETNHHAHEPNQMIDRQVQTRKRIPSQYTGQSWGQSAY